jgi:hypothetical protein
MTSETPIVLPADEPVDLGTIELDIYGGIDPDGGVPDGGK